MSDETVPLRMPQVGNGIETAIVAEWLIEVGERVEHGEPVVVMETDKATSELEAPVSGRLITVHAEDGTEVEVGELIGEFAADSTP
jgi:pyruvate/2-oxoglutarate dehydrogenase complex dihydrolipoamide acyltransferase (E2) component